MNKVSKVVFG